MINKPSPIIIIGMQRSGTSALSGALQKLGVFFGRDELLYQADANNPKGYFEHRKATILNLRCLDAFQMHPTSFNSLPVNWKEFPQAESLRDELKQFLKDDFSHSGRWGIKQPVTSLVLPLYNDVFSEVGITPHYVLCVRNPVETMQSEARLDFGDSYRVMPSLGKRAIGSWLRYTLGAFSDASTYPLTVVDYEGLLSNPARHLQSIVGRHTDWTPSDEDWEKAVKSVSGGLRHNIGLVDELDAFPAIVRQTYEETVRLSSGETTDFGEMRKLHQSFKSWVQILEDPLPLAGKLGLAWLDQGQQRIAEVPYLPNGHWQTIRLRIDAPPKTIISGLIYGLPCRVWIKRSLWHRGTTETVAPIRCGLGSTLDHSRGIYRLDAVFEPNQVQFVTPGGNGPFELELEFLLEYGASISAEASARLARRLEECVSSFEQMARTSQRPNR